MDHDGHLEDRRLRTAAALAPPAVQEAGIERLVVRDAGRVHFVRTDEVIRIDAAGNYVQIRAGQHTHVLRETMSGMEARLDARRFLRVNRSTIVNLARVSEVQPIANGTYVFVMHDGSRIASSRRYRTHVMSSLTNSS